MPLFRRIAHSFTSRERWAFWIGCGAFVIGLLTLISVTVGERSSFVPVAGGTYTEGVVGQPIVINPIVSGNPTDQDLSALLFAPLKELLSIPPEASPDGRTYTLKLKEDLAWDDGTPLTSDDILFSIKTIQDPETRSPLEGGWQGISAERVSEIQIRLTLPTPFAFFNDTISQLHPIPEHIFGSIPIQNLRLSSYNLQPVGNGPYKFKDFSKRKDGFITRYRLIRNERYAGTAPYIDEFVFQFYEGWNDLFSDFSRRRIQGYGSLAPVSADSQSRTVSAERFPMPRYYAIFLNSVTNSSLKEKQVRYALAYAIDKKKLAKDVLGDETLALDSPFFMSLIKSLPDYSSFELESFDPDAIWKADYNPEEARKLLELAKKTDLVLTLSVPDVDFLKKIAASLKEAWEAVGIRSVEVITLPPQELEDAIRPRNYEALLFGNVLQHPLDLFPFWHSSQRFYPGLNLSLYQNIDMDKQMEAMRQSPDVTKNTARLEIINTSLSGDLPALFLFSLPYTYVHTDRVMGITPSMLITPSDRFRSVTEWYMTKARIIN